MSHLTSKVNQAVSDSSVLCIWISILCCDRNEWKMALSGHFVDAQCHFIAFRMNFIFVLFIFVRSVAIIVWQKYFGMVAIPISHSKLTNEVYAVWRVLPITVPWWNDVIDCISQRSFTAFALISRVSKATEFMSFAVNLSDRIVGF